MHQAPENLIDNLAAAVADGSAIDWEAIESSARSDEERTTIRRLRAIAAVRVAYSELTLSDTASESLSVRTQLQGVEDGSAPATWGPLRILERVGRGRFGDVYRAWDPNLDREVALKLLRQRDRADREVIEEGRLMARVRHPNVVTIHGAQRIDGRTGLWMEFVEGRTLEAELKERGPFPADEVAQVGVELCRALAAVHDAGLVHRDVKAQNVLRNQRGQVLLGDFGTGGELDEDRAGPSNIAGTPAYLAPEIFGQTPATPQSDLYGLGVLLFYLATGSYPVQGRTIAQIREAHKSGVRTPIETLRSDLRHALVSVIQRATDRDPARRFESAAAMETALAAAIEAPAQDAERDVRHTDITLRRSPVAAAIALAVVGIVTALVTTRPPAPHLPNPAPTPSPTATVPGPAIGDGELLDAAQTETAPAALNFKGRDWVLITTFENRTGNALLDGTLEYALESELSNSPFVNVVPRDRIEDTFELMRKPADTPLDLRVAREVAARDGLIRAVVTGRVERLGPSYVLTSQIINPDDGAVIATLSEDARQERDLLPAIRRHSFRLRETLGEMGSTIRRSEIALERVTTPSLRAAQLYSRAVVLIGRGDGAGPAEQFLTQAVADDSDFASAHIQLAWAKRRLARSNDEIMTHAQRAVDLVDRTSDVERYFIAGSHQLLSALPLIASGGQGDPRADDHLDRAISAFEALLRIKPDHFWGTEYLYRAYTRRGREPQATEMQARRADLRPNNLAFRWSTTQSYFQRGDTERGRVHLRKAQALNTSEYAREHPEYGAQIQQLETADAWLRLDVKRVRELADDFARQVNASTAAQEDGSIGANLIGIYNALGRYGDARRAAERMPAQRRDVDIGRVLLNATTVGKPGAREALLAHLATLYPNLSDAPAIPPWASALVLVGRLDELRVMVERARRNGYVLFNGSRIRWFVQSAEATLALAEGRVEEALRLFEEAAKQGGRQGTAQARLIADAWIARGELERARFVLEEATGDWTISAISSMQGGFAVTVSNWIVNSERLAEVYRMLGRDTDASAIEAQLLKLLAVAEEPNPMWQRLIARAKSARSSN